MLFALENSNLQMTNVILGETTHAKRPIYYHSSQRGTNIRFAWFLTSLVPKRDFSTTANSEQHCIILVSLEVVWHILFHFCTFIIFCLLSLFGDVPASMFWFCFSNGPDQNGNIWKHKKVMKRLNQAAPRVVLSESQASELTRLPGEQHFCEPFYGEWIDFKWFWCQLKNQPQHFGLEKS